MKKIVSILLVIAMGISLSTTAFAAEKSNTEIITEEDVQLAKEAYDSLSTEAKKIFEDSLALDSEMMEFHKNYVDPSFKVKRDVLTIGTRAVATDPMTILTAQLAALSLPSAVVYSLKAMGAAMVAAIADGPLPIGDILLAAATASTVVVIAANWNTVSSKWSSIISAFKKAFSDSASNVVSAFSKIKSEINSTLKTSPCVTVSGKMVTINGVKYDCKTKADTLTSSQKKGKQYFPAVLYNGTVYVDSTHSLTTSTAKVFLYANNSKVGIWATSATYAKGLCGGNNAIWHNTHSSSEGYFYHYHHPTYKNFHCWYL